jgi:putative hydrolases of HD superfamily
MRGSLVQVQLSPPGFIKNGLIQKRFRPFLFALPQHRTLAPGSTWFPVITNEAAMHTDQLMAHVLPILARRRDDILPLLRKHGGAQSQAILRNDETMHKLAAFCYRALPFPVRLLLKEEAFAGFVLQYRDKLMDALLAEPDSTAPPICATLPSSTTKAANDMDHTALQGCLAFLQQAERLKDTLRSGHTSGGRRESTAEHSWRLALFAMLLEDELPGLDFARILKLCVVHDLGEAIHGDIPAIDQTPDMPDKSARERADLATLAAPLPARLRDQLLALWDEYDAAATPEARIVKGLDKLETMIQHNQGRNPEHFDYAFNLDYGVRHTAHHPLLAALRELVDAAPRARVAAQAAR